MTHLVVDPSEIAGDEVEVEGDRYRHLFRARRLAVGDPVRVVDGRGRARHASVASVGRRRAILVLGAPAEPREPAVTVELLVATPRSERLSWLVEKATELGVTAVRLVASERSPRRLGEGTMARLARVAVAAVEQCGRARVPAVTGVHDAGDLPALVEPLDDLFVLDPGATAGSSALRTGTSAGVLVGPEGGWSPEEVATFADLGARRVGLGERVLRVETAAIVAAARLLVP